MLSLCFFVIGILALGTAASDLNTCTVDNAKGGVIHGAMTCSYGLSGSTCSLPAETCKVRECNAWRKSTCSDALCTCAAGQCIMPDVNGECVDEGDCPKNTGGTCSVVGCDAYRQASCSDGACVCAADQCAVGGVCVTKKGGCAKLTGGSCRVFGCSSWRSAECNAHGKCACGAGLCAVAGQCVALGTCPRYTGDSCNFGSCSGNSQCISGQCQCSGSTCWTGQECVSTEMFMDAALSGTIVETQDDGGSMGTMLVLALIGLVFASFAVRKLSSARGAGAIAADSYQHLDSDE